MGYCQICCHESETLTLKVSPSGHERKHGINERACAQCWEACLSTQVEEKKAEEIECMFCKSKMGEDAFFKFARSDTKTRYMMKTTEESRLEKEAAEDPEGTRKCMARCNRVPQSFDRERDGRVFTCTYCDFQACVDCDHPEHHSQTCAEHQSRHDAFHDADEAKTRKKVKVCPDCKIAVYPEKASCHTQCDNCGHRFCSACMVNWIGVGSAYLWGKEAHGRGCKYSDRDAESDHSLVNRWLQTEEVQGRIDDRKAANKAKNEEKKKKKAMAEEAQIEEATPDFVDTCKKARKKRSAPESNVSKGARPKKQKN